MTQVGACHPRNVSHDNEQSDRCVVGAAEVEYKGGVMETATTEVAPLLRALEFAARKHRDQRRKDQEASPYINHPIQVSSLLAHDGGVRDLSTLCAAILHDTVEDTETSLEELVEQFGAEIAGLVAEVTDDKSLDKARRKQLQIEHAPELSAKAKLVKLADKICNLRDMASSPPASWSLERKREYFDWAKRVVDGLRGTNPALEQLFDRAYAARP
jgi:GTP diphosphokinase / guanosine-3',5'-bis(diphosphate) 3'-diphosphatase